MTAYGKCPSCGFDVLAYTREEVEEKLEFHICIDEGTEASLTRAHFMRKYGVHHE